MCRRFKRKFLIDSRDVALCQWMIGNKITKKRFPISFLLCFDKRRNKVFLKIEALFFRWRCWSIHFYFCCKRPQFWQRKNEKWETIWYTLLFTFVAEIICWIFLTKAMKTLVNEMKWNKSTRLCATKAVLCAAS